MPVANLHLISRYSGAGEGAAPLHKLGTDQWEKARRRAMQAARDTAAELLNLYALRAAREHLELARQHAMQDDQSLDLFAEELRLAQDQLSGITGQFTPDDLLGVIFSRFCIGK